MRRFRPTGMFGTETAHATGPIDFCKRDAISEIAPIDGSHWKLCLHPLHYRRDQNPDLGELLESPTASNPLFHPAFVNAGRDRVTRGRLFQMVLWEISGAKPSARLAIPLGEHASLPWQDPSLRSLTHPYAPLGTPLLHSPDENGSNAFRETVERFVDSLAIAFADGLPDLVLDYLPVDSPFVAALGECPTATGRQRPCVSVRSNGERATLLAGHADPLGNINKKRMREYRRLEKKLGQTGVVSYEIARDPMDVLVRLEEFLLLEARSWKGRQGTSIHNLKRHAAFARQAVHDFARNGQAEIATLRVSDVAVASTLLINLNGHYFPWKTAYNETLSRYSPGTLLMIWLTRELVEREDFVSADSLAKFGNSWMTALWPDKRGFCTAVIARDCASADSRHNEMTRSARAKSVVKRLLGRS